MYIRIYVCVCVCVCVCVRERERERVCVYVSRVACMQKIVVDLGVKITRVCSRKDVMFSEVEKMIFSAFSSRLLAGLYAAATAAAVP
jgi:hypothetical protein